MMEYKIKCTDRHPCEVDGKICSGYCYLDGQGEGTYYPDFKDVESEEKSLCSFSGHMTKKFREENKMLEKLI